MPTSAMTTSLTPLTSSPSASSSSPDSSALSTSSSLSSPSSSPPLKICCACPETRGVRDNCIIEKGQEACMPLIEQHKQCLRQLGFKI